MSDAWMQPEFTLVRATDKWTSKVAAMGAQRWPKGQQLLELLRELGPTEIINGKVVGGVINQEGADILGEHDGEIHKRMRELVRAQYAIDSGHVRRSRKTGFPQAVWQITPLGLTGGWPLPKPKPEDVNYEGIEVLVSEIRALPHYKQVQVAKAVARIKRRPEPKKKKKGGSRPGVEVDLIL